MPPSSGFDAALREQASTLLHSTEAPFSGATRPLQAGSSNLVAWRGGFLAPLSVLVMSLLLLRNTV